MKRKTVKISMCFFLIFIFFTGSDIYSQGRNRNIGRRMNYNNLANRNAQNLTNNQIEKIQIIRNECYAQQEMDQKLLYEKTSMLNTLISTGDREKEAVNRLIGELNIEIKELQQKIITKANYSETKIDALLTDQQKAQYNNRGMNGLGIAALNGNEAGYGYGAGRGFGNGRGNRWGAGNQVGRGNGRNVNANLVPGQGNLQNNQQNYIRNGRGYYCPWNNINNNNSVNIRGGRNARLNDGRLHRNRWR